MSKTDTVARLSLIFARKVDFSENSEVIDADSQAGFYEPVTDDGNGNATAFADQEA